MKSVGIIAEYNPFHKGHLYHLNKIKEMYKGYPIILILIGNYTQRGEMSVISKWDKTAIALKYGVNLVVELPFVFCVQGSDIYAKGAIELLKELDAGYLVFGSESNDIDLFNKVAEVMDTKECNELVRSYLDSGCSYPFALSKASECMTNISFKEPNDLLALSYIKEIKKQDARIIPISIKRTDDYHISGSLIRDLIRSNGDLTEMVQNDVLKYINNKFIDDYYSLLKYKIITEVDELDKYQLVEEGIENRIKKYIYSSNSLEELISKVKTKRYTYNRLKRMFALILCNIKKEDKYEHNEYIRVLGFDRVGKQYLKKIKPSLEVITKYSKIKSKIFKLEVMSSSIYDDNYMREYQQPIIKE